MAVGQNKPTSIGQLGLGMDITDAIADLQDQDFSFIAQDSGNYTTQDLLNAVDTSGIDWSKAGGLTGTPDPAQTVNPLFQNPDGSINRESPWLRANQKQDSNIQPYSGGGGGTLGSSTGFTLPPNLTELMNSLYAGLEEQAQEQLGGLETKDFTDDIRSLIEEGKGDAQQLHDLQMDQLGAASDRREQQIGEIEQELLSSIEDSEQQRLAMSEQLMTETTAREGLAKGNTLEALEMARAGLGNQVSDQFESVAGLVGGLAEQQRASSLASQQRLRVVANMAAAERMAAPAKLAAEAKMAVGDEKFRMENQLRTQLAQNMAQLNTSEREMVLQEAMRQEQFGIEKDQALANAMMQIGQQRVSSSIQEAQRIESVRIRQEEILQQQNFQRQMAAAAAARAAAAAQANREFQREMKESDREYADKIRASEWAREDGQRALEKLDELQSVEERNKWAKEAAIASGQEWDEDAPQTVKDALFQASVAGLLQPDETYDDSFDYMSRDVSELAKTSWLDNASAEDKRELSTVVSEMLANPAWNDFTESEGDDLAAALRDDKDLMNRIKEITGSTDIYNELQPSVHQDMIFSIAVAMARGIKYPEEEETEEE